MNRRATELLVTALVALKKYKEVKEVWGRCCNAPGVRFFVRVSHSPWGIMVG